MKNKLIDVHNILMATLEDLDNDDLFQDKETANLLLKRAKAKADVAKEIIALGDVSLRAIQYQETASLPDYLQLDYKKAK